MRSLSQKAQRVFDRLTDGLVQPTNGAVGRQRTIANSEAFMPVHVEVVERTADGSLIVSIAHYYKQNGDLMADPEMTFLYTTADGKAYPLTFRQDATGTYWVGAYRNPENGHWMLRQRLQRDHAVFANQWMENIRHQQFAEGN